MKAMSLEAAPAPETADPAADAAAPLARPRLLRRQLADIAGDADLARFLSFERARLMAAWTPQNGGETWTRAHTILIDETVRRLFALAVERAGAAQDGEEDGPPAVAIVATGGYGRRDLSPRSDLDITFLPARDDDALVSRVIKEMFRLVMDVFLSGAKIKVGYAYRLLSDHDQLDHQTQTALLDARCVAGDAAVFARFDQLFRARLQPTDFVFRKYAERNATLDKNTSGDGTASPYNVEPNLKEGAGGLRDLQSATWVAHVRYSKRGDALWRDLVKRNVVTHDEAEQLIETREFLFRVRNLLHLSASEARETLTAERQEAIAARLGYEDENGVPGVERFMRDYYHHVAGLHHVANKILVRCLDSPLPLGSGLASVKRRVTVWDADEAAREPLWPFKALRACQTYDLDLGLTTEEAIQRHVHERLLPAPPHEVDDLLRGAGRLLLELLSRPRNVYWAVRQMQRTGLLAFVLPALDACMDLIPYDPAHEHTVGEHSLLVLRNLERVRNTSGMADAARDNGPSLLPYRHVMEEVNAPEALYLAALLHDVGKQWPGGRHAETGADYAQTWCEKLGCPPHVTEHVTFLIRQHLLMAETSRLRDLALDETVQDFARLVPDMERLRMLYLLTFADTHAVGAGVWTEVKARFLAELFGRAETVLAAPPDEEGDARPAGSSAPDVQAFRERVRRQLGRGESGKLPPAAIHEHTVAMPASYLLNTSLDDMYLHIALIARARDTFKPLVDSRTPFGSNYTELTVVAYDDPKPGLLAKIAAVLYAHDVNLHSAQVFTRTSSDRIAIDTLWVDYRDKPLTPVKRRELEETFRQVLTGEVSVSTLLTRKGKHTQTVQPVRSLLLDDTTSPNYSILDVQAPDTRGVVYRLAEAISSLGWNIHSARLSTWRGNARNAYYLTDTAGNKIPAAAVSLLDDLLPRDEAHGASGTLLRARTNNAAGARK